MLWGGEPLTNHNIPECYGAIKPTAVYVPLKAMKDPEVFKLVTTEVFGPFYVLTEYDGEGLRVRGSGFGMKVAAVELAWACVAVVW